MAHPMNHLRQSKVEKSRVPHITRGYASGGAVKGMADKTLTAHRAQHEAMGVDGEKGKRRSDRPNRAAGGRVKKGRNSSKTIINVINGGDKAAPPPMPSPMGAGVAPPMAPPPMAMKPPMPGPGPGMPPPGMPMRARGGRIGVNTGTKVFEASERAGTQVSHDPGKNDTNDEKRPGMKMKPRVVTFATGGGVVKFKTGGRVESPDGVAKATKLPGGAAGGEARLAQAHRAARK